MMKSVPTLEKQLKNPTIVYENNSGAGSALAASGGVAGNTVIVTHMESSVSALIWAGLSWIRTGKPYVVATINGAIAGLAGITPASGFVSVEHAFVISIAVGIISYSGVVLFKEKLKIDDALDVSSVHGVASIVGALAIGIFASTAINPGGLMDCCLEILFNCEFRQCV